MTQLWVGNIPASLSEAEVLFQMAAYGLRPWKCVYRKRQGGEGWDNCYFATPALAGYRVPLEHWQAHAVQVSITLTSTGYNIFVIPCTIAHM